MKRPSLLLGEADVQAEGWCHGEWYQDYAIVFQSDSKSQSGCWPVVSRVGGFIFYSLSPFQTEVESVADNCCCSFFTPIWSFLSPFEILLL